MKTVIDLAVIALLSLGTLVQFVTAWRIGQRTGHLKDLGIAIFITFPANGWVVWRLWP